MLPEQHEQNQQNNDLMEEQQHPPFQNPQLPMVNYQLGLATLSGQINTPQNITLFNGIVLDILDNQHWKIKSLSTDEVNRWKRIINFLIISQAKMFQYASNPNPQILIEIVPKSFPNLTGINLYDCGIANYQPLTFLESPFLSYLNIIYNNTPNFKIFGKMNFPQLKVICIYIRRRNFLVQNVQAHLDFSIQQFQRWGCNEEQLRLQKGGWDAVMLQDFSKLAKAKPSLKNVYYCRFNRINQEKVRNILRENRGVNFNVFEEVENQQALNNMLNEMDI